jgi:hypothetical protein
MTFTRGHRVKSQWLMADEQGDQIGRKFARRGDCIFILGRIFSNIKAEAKSIWLHFRRLRLCIIVNKNGLGYTFLQNHLFTLFTLTTTLLQKRPSCDHRSTSLQTKKRRPTFAV